MARYRQPHLLLITTDQQRGDCLGCEGHPAVETPYIDQMAENGSRFRHAYTSVPSCTPARAGIITGMDQWNHGRLTMTGNDALDFPATLPGELAAAGYHTRLVGKAHHAPQRALQGFHDTHLDESGRRDKGFISDYHAHFDRAKEGEYGYRDHSIEWNSWMARPSHLPEHLHPSYWTASEAIQSIETRDPTSPLFMWMSFARPHSPYDPPQAYWDMYVDHPDIPAPHLGDWAVPYGKPIADVNAPRTRRSAREIHRGRAGYYGNISFIDHQIGRVLYEYGKRDPEGLANTLILFTSDHGDMMGDHNHWRKTYAYEGSARIPFVVQWPSAWGSDVPRGHVNDEPIELRDIMPTLLDAAGVDIPDSVDGSSLMDLHSDNSDWRDFVQGEHTTCYDHEHGMQYVTDGREKFIWFHHTDQEQFFDLRSDPSESHNLSADPAAADRIDVWRQRLARINEERGDPRGQAGQLVAQPDGALRLSPNYARWRDQAAQRVAHWQGR
ncbi:MAG: arylsulfatase [Gemmatimonadetes bacterium]|jgi:arylsulfatase A-like enzyme|nr:arylsulfatase [Gemmatimonadota bacterium]MBT5056784.1 arylsulfatase [Gemmatimonadota bacterium]MBT5143493.1 arylsulfatase [Gemmatimonadota bacterium]MBT5590184.1 arylsulfatase [Gemmatimonadota bacterium]MBT5963647.1 arylsulfatase [Gemmatimonadota bacterium]